MRIRRIIRRNTLKVISKILNSINENKWDVTRSI